MMSLINLKTSLLSVKSSLELISSGSWYPINSPTCELSINAGILKFQLKYIDVEPVYKNG
jgi:hypothetical protein